MNSCSVAATPGRHPVGSSTHFVPRPDSIAAFTWAPENLLPRLTSERGRGARQGGPGSASWAGCPVPWLCPCRCGGSPAPLTLVCGAICWAGAELREVGNRALQAGTLYGGAFVSVKWRESSAPVLCSAGTGVLRATGQRVLGGSFPLLHPWAMSSTVWGRRADQALPVMDKSWHSGPF